MMHKHEPKKSSAKKVLLECILQKNFFISSLHGRLISDCLHGFWVFCVPVTLKARDSAARHSG